ncbi:DUF1707 domain-containing protein [Auraticoccus sp. F435]|uniref:DUF1707 domain-containing protein n=1 Tax=Auraticoccus cholistanensis TaxID=2656650 RepID=A0A6A9V070_9ACTN|nr:DUF1707 domain-containing protein [Auraticoccus cholistanensis]MVA74910.1 DUF1707 domain-containing protein [Auraticoccus cholistanensis]
MPDVPDQPAPRIGDRERDLAVEYLQEHHAAGRLSTAEFDERMGRALAARVEADLLPLFVDLPEPRIGPGRSVAELATRAAAPVPTGPSRRMVVTGKLLAGASWPVAIVAASLLGWGSFWWFVFIPLFVTPWLLGVFGLDEDGEPGGQRDDEDDSSR